MEFDEHEDQEEEIGIPAAMPGYDTHGNLASGAGMRSNSKGGGGGGGDTGATTASSRKGDPNNPTIKYRECLKNHAVSIGGQAHDGCGEFLAAGDEGTMDALKCAACNCHRNFHRKETDGETTSCHVQQHHLQHQHQQHHHYQQQFSPYHRGPPPPAGYLHHHLTTTTLPQNRPLALPAAASGGGHCRDEEDMSNPSSSGGGGGGGGSGSGMKKRFRTKFTQEQKEKMLAFAQRVGWRIQKHDEAAVDQFCEETGVKRNVLKVWMHNNKYTLGKKP